VDKKFYQDLLDRMSDGVYFVNVDPCWRRHHQPGRDHITSS
jgi:hypothetical protein